MSIFAQLPLFGLSWLLAAAGDVDFLPLPPSGSLLHTDKPHTHRQTTHTDLWRQRHQITKISRVERRGGNAGGFSIHRPWVWVFVCFTGVFCCLRFLHARAAISSAHGGKGQEVQIERNRNSESPEKFRLCDVTSRLFLTFLVFDVTCV